MSKVEHFDIEFLDKSLPDSQTRKKKKKNKKKKKSSKKQTVKCHDCHELFHGSEKSGRHTCPRCQLKPALIVLPLKRVTIPSLSVQEDEEDICPVCDTDCTCGTNTAADPLIEAPKDNVVERIGVAMKKKPRKKKERKIRLSVVQTLSEEEDIIVDDLDDLLDTMSPLSDIESGHERIGGKELFTDESEYIDSGDDQDIEIAETQAIIDELEVDVDEESDSSQEIMYIEDEEDTSSEEVERGKIWSHWSTTDEEESELDIDLSFDYEATSPIAENDNTYDNIVSAFMHALAPSDPGGTETNGVKTPVVGKDEQLSAFELANALSLLSSYESNKPTDLVRRPSLPSNALSAAQRHRGSHDFSSEAFRTLSNIISDDLPLSLGTNHASFPYSSNSFQLDSSLHIQDQLPETIENNKRSPGIENTNDSKKRKLSRPSIEVPTEEVSMDDLLDISQLHSDEEDSQDHPYSKDLSRWQRIPIGAFRLMRSKNKLWLER